MYCCLLHLLPSHIKILLASLMLKDLQPLFFHVTLQNIITKYINIKYNKCYYHCYCYYYYYKSWVPP